MPPAEIKLILVCPFGSAFIYFVCNLSACLNSLIWMLSMLHRSSTSYFGGKVFLEVQSFALCSLFGRLDSTPLWWAWTPWRWCQSGLSKGRKPAVMWDSRKLLGMAGWSRPHAILPFRFHVCCSRLPGKSKHACSLSKARLRGGFCFSPLRI